MGGNIVYVYVDYLVYPTDPVRFNVNNSAVTSADNTAAEVYYTGSAAQFGTGDNQINENVDRPVIIRYLSTTKKVDAFAQEIGDTIKLCIGAKQDTQLYRREGKNGEYYGVLRGAKAVGCPVAFILEHGFHTCTKTTEYLLNNDNLKYMAEQECKVICNYYGYTYVPDGQPTPGPSPEPTDLHVVYQAYANNQWLPEVNKADDTPAGYAGIKGVSTKAFRCRLSDWSALHYRARRKNGLWFAEVDRWSDQDNGYAGNKKNEIDYIMVWSERGHKIAYRVFANGKWQPWVYQANISDKKYGMAGIGGKAISGIQIKIY